MSNSDKEPAAVSEIEQIETLEWLESLDYVLKSSGPERVAQLLERLETHAHKMGVDIPFSANTPYINTIAVEKQPHYPGSLEIERRIRAFIRWNAMAMVVKANKNSNVGGHISTYASSATLYEVGFNHFFRGKDDPSGGDQVFFQGHASPGMYSRAYLEGRLCDDNLTNFRQELRGNAPGLSSYPHPWLMPDFWEFPTVSMGLGPIGSIYQARFNRYLHDRGLKDTSEQRVWCYIGDGETDEPETLGAISLAAREKLDNLTFVINCNLQRLDGPVRGNGKIIQELETIFRGAGWNVIKVVWGGDWDTLLAQDQSGDLVKRMGEVVDGQYQKYSVSSGEYVREHFFGATENTRKIADQLTDEHIRTIRRGGHDPEKVYAAYAAALATKGKPTVILAKTIKGYGLGDAGEGKNSAHNSKKVDEASLRAFRDRFGIPVSDEELSSAPFYRPSEDSPEIQYLKERRKALGGPVPQRRVTAPLLPEPSEDIFKQFYSGTNPDAKEHPSTTQVTVTMMYNLLRDKEIGQYIVPIVPDEARTFGMEGLIGSFGIYSHIGQLYEPVDRQNIMYYKEATNGRILEEGINEAGSMASFIAAGTAYATHGLPMIPMYIYYSMFGLQRVGDQVWLAGDIRAKGFLLGGTAGRTSLSGEGLQHQDGHSHLNAFAFPNMQAYDPAYAYEIAVIIKDGIKRMYANGEEIFYYITLMNDTYAMPPMPETVTNGITVREGIVKGLYKYKNAPEGDYKAKAQLFGSGAILNGVIEAQEMLKAYGVAADVWSVTSYQQLYRDCMEAERWNLLHPGETPRETFVGTQLAGSGDVVVAASDYVKALPESISQYVPYPMACLGTDGFGRSDGRKALRDFFEVDSRYVVLATLTELAKIKKIKWDVVKKAQVDLGINPEKLNPHRV